MVLLVDLALPNCFRRKVKEVLEDPGLLTRDVERLVRQFLEREPSKHPVLDQLRRRQRSGRPPGALSPVIAEVP